MKKLLPVTYSKMRDWLIINFDYKLNCVHCLRTRMFLLKIITSHSANSFVVEH